MQRFKGVIFDLDGTLLDTIQDIANAMNTILKRYNFPTHDLDSYRFFIGSGIAKLVERSLPSEVSESAKYPKLVEEVFQEYALHLNKFTAPYPGVVDLLDGLTQLGVPFAILSNKADEFMDEVVSNYFSKWDFAVVLGARYGLPKKPDPYSVLEIAEIMALQPSEIVYLGDTDIDMQTAVNSGTYAVGAAWGFRSAEELRANGAHVVIQNPCEILELFQDVG